MKISRRKFLGSAPLAGFTVASASSLAVGQIGLPGRTSGQKEQEMMSLASFSSALNSPFLFRGPNGSNSILTLDGVENAIDTFEERNQYGGANFILRFSGRRALRGDVYSVVHDEIGKFKLFITEGEATAGARSTYIAVINNVAA